MFNFIFNSNIDDVLREMVYSHFEKFKPLFEKYFVGLKDIDIYFLRDGNEDDSVKVWGVAHLIDQYVQFVIFSDDFSEADFVYNIFHELNHTYRGFYDKNFVLMVDIINEGLALNFEKDIRTESGVWWDDKKWYYQEKERDMIIKRLAEAIDICENKKSYSHNAWMYNFDGENPDFPTNLGYKIGDFLVGEYCKFHNIKAIEAVRIPTQEFIDFAKKEILCEK